MLDLAQLIDGLAVIPLLFGGFLGSIFSAIAGIFSIVKSIFSPPAPQTIVQFPPPPPLPPQLPPPPTLADPAAVASRQRSRQRAALSTGRQQTILTKGGLEPASTTGQKSTLLKFPGG